MAQLVAFEAAVEGLSGASMSVGDGKTYDIAKELKDGGGQIVLDLEKSDQNVLATALEVHPAVKSAPVAKKGSK